MELTVLGEASSPAQLIHARILAKRHRSPDRFLPSSSFASCSTSPLQRSVAPAPRFDLDSEQLENFVDEELAWYDNTVIWSRGAQVYRTYSFDSQGEDVVKAAFVLFPSLAPTGLDQSPADLLKLPASKGKAPATATTPFGPFSTSQNCQWGAPRGVTATGLESPGVPQVSRLERTLVIFLRTYANIYLPSGETITTHIPFLVDGVWPLAEGGVVLQRSLERRERKRWARRKMVTGQLDRMDHDRTSGSILDELVDLDDEVESLPRLYTLSTPRGEARPMAQTPSYEGGYLSEQVRITSPIRPLSSEMSIILVSSRPYPLMIAIDHEAREIVFYRWARIPTVSEPAANARSPTLSPLAGLHPVMENPSALPPKASRPSALRKRSSLGPSLGTDRRSSALGVGVADPLDRSNRRSSIQRQPRSSGIPEGRASTGEILHATLELEDPFKAAASRPLRGKRGPRGLSSGGMLDVDRRVSVGRSDLNRSMDRMALNAAEEADLRETTMLFGLERDDDGLASEVVTERIWTWPLPDHKDIDAEDVKAFLSDTRSPQQALIHIHYTPVDGTPAALRTFRIQLDPSSPRYAIEPFQAFECSSAVPIISTREEVPDTLALSNEGVLELLTSDGRNIPVTLPAASRAVTLSDPVGTRFTITFADGHTARCSVDRRIQDWLARQCFEMLSLVMPPRDFYSLKVELAVRQAVSWPSFAEVLGAILSLPASPAPPTSPSEKLVHVGERSQDPLTRRLAASRSGRGITLARTRTQPQCNQVSPEAAAAALLALHLVGEDCRLDAVRERRLPELVPLIAQLSNNLHRVEWTDHWMRLYPLALTGIQSISATMERSPSQLLDSFDVPPNILTCLRRCIMGKSARYPINSQLTNPLASGQCPELGDVRPLLLTEQVMSVFRALAPTDLTPLPVSRRAPRAILLMVKAGLDETWVDRLTLAVAMPIREAMKVCQSAPERDWPLDAYRLIGRSDQAMQSLARAGDEFQRSNDVNGNPIPISAILRSVQPFTTESGKTQRLSAEPPAAPDVRFGADKRLQEVANILQTHRTRTIAVTEPANADEQELTAFCHGVAIAIAHRTMAVAVGRGIFSYGTKNAVITDAWTVPPFELSITLSPSKTSVKPTLTQETIDWPNFHNGVAEALSISPNSGGIDSSWIVFNKPATFSASHGGFLLGLGLSGHLRCMQTWHAYPYLEPRHDFTTIGLLLGLGSSFAGSQDAMVTKVLSLHTHALLPLGSVELSASTGIQSAALVGLGLLYMGSGSHRMADAVLKEIGRKTMPGVQSFTEYQELYSFSASMAFGLIMLGQGGQASSQVERGMVDQLRQRIIGEAASLDISESRSSARRIDSTYTAPGATLAIALMFMKTHRKDITDILEIPQTPYALDHVRPDLLLLRTLARALINWDDITPGMPWIDSQLPACIQDLHKDHRKISTMGLPSELAYFNVIAGACFAIGLKYAGTATEFAHTTLLFFFGVFGKATSNSTMTYEGKIRRTAARQGLNLITIALAMVMSGTGELHVLRRLRVSHGQEGAGVNYGTHMAMHMACGILFLGHGRYTLGSSNAATAAMCIACFPRFSASPTDNKVYLQAYRHLWALAVEPRCLIGRDVDTHQTVYVPVKLRVMEGHKVKSQALIAPTLVAPFERLVSIEIDSPRYWPVTYDVRGNQRDRQNLIRTGTIFVKRKAAFLDYNNDPKGNRSIFVRAGTMSGSDLHYDLVSSASPSPVSDEDFIALTTFHSGEPHIKALGEILCRGQASIFTKFAKFALLECISLDKASMFYHYIGAFNTLRAVTAFVAAQPQRRSDAAKEAKDAAAFFQHLRLLQTYYSSSVFDRFYAHNNPAADKRTLLFRPAFLATLVLTLPGETSAVVHQTARRGFYRRLVSPPLETDTGSLALALYLGANNVPPLGLLQGLRSIVRRTAEVYRGAGVSREDIIKILSGKICETSRRFDDIVGGDGDEGAAKIGKAKIAIDNTARLWKLGSAIETLDAWAEEVEPVDL